MFKFNKTKSFLFNKNEKYGRLELLINWTLVLSLILALIFMISFAISLQNLEIDDPKKLAYIKLPEPTNTLAIVAFLTSLIAITSIILKMFFSFKRGVKNAKSSKR